MDGERTLQTITLPDGSSLVLSQRFTTADDFSTGQAESRVYPGLKLFRHNGHTIALPDAIALLTRAGHTDVLARFHIPTD